MSVQSLGYSHRPFSDLKPAGQFEELLFSKILLEARMEKRIDALAFPCGDAGVDPNSAIHLVF